ncbi:MAG TPA: hypothetical protein VIE90_18185 [Candidatus Binatia bacterium]
MKDSIHYKNCLIRGDSFQFAQSNGWIPRYTLMSDQSDGIPSHHDRLDKVFSTQNEADKFAVRDAMRWIDEHCRLQG